MEYQKLMYVEVNVGLHPGEDASLPLSTGGSYQILVNNVFYFTQRVVDKLWQGMFNKDSKLVVDFIVQLIGQVHPKEPSRSKKSAFLNGLMYNFVTVFIVNRAALVCFYFMPVYPI